MLLLSEYRHKRQEKRHNFYTTPTVPILSTSLCINRGEQNELQEIVFQPKFST